jgi:hypothetical protein
MTAARAAHGAGRADRRHLGPVKSTIGGVWPSMSGEPSVIEWSADRLRRIVGHRGR